MSLLVCDGLFGLLALFVCLFALCVCCVFVRIVCSVDVIVRCDHACVECWFNVVCCGLLHGDP